MKSSGTENPITAFFVRKEPKEHGYKSAIEGIIESPVVIVDDVITKGESAMKAVTKIKGLHKVVGIITIV